MIEKAFKDIKQLSENQFIQDKFDSYVEFILEREVYPEKFIDDYKQSVEEMRESLLKEYFDYKGIDYKNVKLQCKNMNNFKLKDGLLHKISYTNEKCAYYYCKEEFIMREDYGVFYLGEWYV